MKEDRVSKWWKTSEREVIVDVANWKDLHTCSERPQTCPSDSGALDRVHGPVHSGCYSPGPHCEFQGFSEIRRGAFTSLFLTFCCRRMNIHVYDRIIFHHLSSPINHIGEWHQSVSLWYCNKVNIPICLLIKYDCWCTTGTHASSACITQPSTKYINKTNEHMGFYSWKDSRSYHIH